MQNPWENSFICLPITEVRILCYSGNSELDLVPVKVGFKSCYKKSQHQEFQKAEKESTI